MFAGEERLSGEVEVGLVGGGDDDELDGWICEGFFNRAQDAGAGVGFGGLVPFALDDGFEAQAGNGADEGGVKDATRKTKSDNGYADFRVFHAGSTPIYGDVRPEYNNIDFASQHCGRSL